MCVCVGGATHNFTKNLRKIEEYFWSVEGGGSGRNSVRSANEYIQSALKSILLESLTYPVPKRKYFKGDYTGNNFQQVSFPVLTHFN